MDSCQMKYPNERDGGIFKYRSLLTDKRLEFCQMLQEVVQSKVEGVTLLPLWSKRGVASDPIKYWLEKQAWEQKQQQEKLQREKEEENREKEIN